MLIMKFGGTSVGSVLRMQQVANLILDEQPKVVVLSAMAGTTNALVEIADALYKDDSEKALQLISNLTVKYEEVVMELFNDETHLAKGQLIVRSHMEYLKSFTEDLFTVNEEKAILAQGELLSTALFHTFLTANNIAARLLPALDFMRLNADGDPDYPQIQRLLQQQLAAEALPIVITQGYICRNAFGEVDNLQRGGSDFTATIIGAVLKAKEIQIWTDIDGMHNNDPRVVSNTFPITELSYDEAAELAYFGARILHPSCVQPAQKANVPIRLLNTMQPEAGGTIIHAIRTNRPVTAIAAKDGITVISIRSGRMLQAYGFLRAVFEVFERYRTPIDMIATSEVGVSLTIDNATYLNEMLDELADYGTVEFEAKQTIVCVVGDFSRNRQDEAFRVLEALKDIPLRMVAYGGSENNISVVVPEHMKAQAMKALNVKLFNTENR